MKFLPGLRLLSVPKPCELSLWLPRAHVTPREAMRETGQPCLASLLAEQGHSQPWQTAAGRARIYQG